LPETGLAAASWEGGPVQPVKELQISSFQDPEIARAEWPALQSDPAWRPSSKSQPKVLWEDSDILVLSKPSRWLCEVTRDARDRNLMMPRETSVKALVDSHRREHVVHFIQLKFAGRSDFPLAGREGGFGRGWGLAHRLDVDTSGCLLIGKTRLGYDHLCRAFATHAVNKEYICLVHGRVEKAKGSIEEPIAVSKNNRFAYISPARGRPAHTAYRVIARYSCGDQLYTLCCVTIHTGRTHQIRVHMKSIGHPLVGDAKYGPQGAQALQCPRIFLHAQSIQLTTVQGVVKVISDQLPEDLSTTLNSRWIRRAD